MSAWLNGILRNVALLDKTRKMGLACCVQLRWEGVSVKGICAFLSREAYRVDQQKLIAGLANNGVVVPI